MLQVTGFVSDSESFVSRPRFVLGFFIERLLGVALEQSKTMPVLLCRDDTYKVNMSLCFCSDLWSVYEALEAQRQHAFDYVRHLSMPASRLEWVPS